MNKNIPIPTLKRLPLYYNIVCQLSEEGFKFVSSGTIASQLGIDDTQVRKDIAVTGYVGKPKVGFDLLEFKSHLENFLGLNKETRAFLIGAGNLGIAIARYEGFKKYGLEISAIFDNDPMKIGLKINNKEVFSIRDIPNKVNEESTNIAIITVPAKFAQEITDYLIKSGITAIWNFAPINLKVPDNVIVWNQDIGANFVTFAQVINQQQ